MTSKKLILFIIVCFGFSVNSFSQTKEITQDNYYQPKREAYKTSVEISSRKISKKEYFKDGKLVGTTDGIYETLPPDKLRYIYTEKENGITKKVEIIQIGKTYFCRTNDGDWKESKTWCSDGGFAALPDNANIKYTVEETKLDNQTVKLFQQNITYKNNYSPNKDKEGLSYIHTKYWLNNKGLILREEVEYGLLEPKQVKSHTVETYEYNPKELKIEAPLVKTKSQ